MGTNMATPFRVDTFVGAFPVGTFVGTKSRGVDVGTSVDTFFSVGTNVGIFVATNVGTLNILKIC